MSRDFPVKQLDAVKQEAENFNPQQQLFLNALETFLSAQKMLSEDDISDLIKKTTELGAPDFAEMVGTIRETNASYVHIPVGLHEKFLSTNEVADTCGVSVQMVRRECEKGNIQAKRGVKKSWIIPESELQNEVCSRWLENKQTMLSQLKQAKSGLQDSEEFLNNLENMEQKRKN